MRRLGMVNQSVNQSINKLVNQSIKLNQSIYNRLTEKCKADKNATMITSSINRFDSHYDTRGQRTRQSRSQLLRNPVQVAYIFEPPRDPKGAKNLEQPEDCN